jgi:hypothetical protein
LLNVKPFGKIYLYRSRIESQLNVYMKIHTSRARTGEICWSENNKTGAVGFMFEVAVGSGAIVVSGGLEDAMVAVRFI